MKANELVGHCLCKETSYSIAGDPKFSYLCQCRQCQLATGSPHAALIMVLAKDFELFGELQFSHMPADSGNMMSRGFCPTCGTPIVAISSGYPDLRFVTAGSLEDTYSFKPTQALWHSQAISWDVVDSRLKINERGPVPK